MYEKVLKKQVSEGMKKQQQLKVPILFFHLGVSLVIRDFLETTNKITTALWCIVDQAIVPWIMNRMWYDVCELLSNIKAS